MLTFITFQENISLRNHSGFIVVQQLQNNSLAFMKMVIIAFCLLHGVQALGKPLLPEESIQSFQLESQDLRVSLVASEPQVIDPVAMCFDEKGRLFVVESRGYPNAGREMPKSRLGVVARLEDMDEDGIFEKRVTFACDFTFPNGILPYKNGFFVTDAPDIYYLEDTDDDGVADKREIILTGFFTNSSSEQLRVASPVFGPDGWVYLTSGLTGGKVTSPKHPDRPAVEGKRNDWRFHPETLVVESLSGTGQFGQAFDHLGRRYVCDNRHPIRWVVFSKEELSRNPNYPGTQPMMDLAEAGAATPLYPLSPDTTAASFHTKLMHNLHAGTFTSCSGLAYYTGKALPRHRGNFFICEPAQNLVHSRSVVDREDRFFSRASAEGREFLASPDQWFRPVFALNGPDGALYLCDMYRKYVDHPNYLPKEAAAKLDFDAGKQHGRIWKITSTSRARPLALKKETGVTQAIRTVRESKADLNTIVKLAEKSGTNPWFRAAAFNSMPGKAQSLLEKCTHKTPPIFIEEVASIAAKETQGGLKNVVEKLLQTQTQWTAPHRFALVLGTGQATHLSDQLSNEAKGILQDSRHSSENRLYALRILPKKETGFLLNFVSSQEVAEIRDAAIREVATKGDGASTQKLLTLRSSLGPESANTIIDALSRKTANHPMLLTAIEEGSLPLHAVPLNQRRRFTNNAKVKARASKLFQADESSDRMKTYEAYKSILNSSGNPSKGEQVYRKVCASCHRIGEIGHDVGPDLTGLKNQPAEALLQHILVPNREVYPTYTLYTAETQSGEAYAGIMKEENDTAITLVMPLGQKKTIQRKTLKSLNASPLSLMPDGLEKTMTKEELRDLMKFLKN